MPIRPNQRRDILHTALVAVVIIFCFGAAGEICGPFFETTADAFEAKFPDNNPKDIENVREQLALAGTDNKGSDSHPYVIIAVTEPEEAVACFDLSAQKELWRRKMPVNSKLFGRGDLAILQSGQDVVALDAATGRVRAAVEIDEGWDFYGAAASGDVMVFTTGIGRADTAGYSNGRIIAVNMSTGRQLWENITGNGILGAPAAWGNRVFVPWKKNKISVLGLQDGAEVARLLTRDFSVNFVHAINGDVFYGAEGTDKRMATLFRFDARAAAGTRDDSGGFSPGIPPAPNTPGFGTDGFRRPLPGFTSPDRVRFYFTPQKSSDRISLANNRYYLHYWRYVVALSAETDAVQWTSAAPEDLGAVHATEHGLFTVSTNGTIRFLSAETGRSLWEAPTDCKPASVLFHVPGFVPARDTSPDRPDPRLGLRDIILDNDNRLIPFRAWAVSLLGRLEIPEVTADLMALYADATLPPALQTALTQALQNRTSGLDYMQQALQMKYDYLEQTKSPPMGIIAPSLARFNDAASLDGLMAHLFDHETPATDMTPIAAAILETGNETIVPSLRDFAILYHADTSFLGHEDALATICRAILAFGGTDGSTLVASLRDDPQTLPGLRKQLLVILDPDAEAKAAAKKAEEEQAAALAKQAELEKKKAEAFANRPDYLAPGHIRVMMGKASVLLRPCIKDALSRRMSLTQVRMNFAIDGTTGAASDLKVIPADIPGLEQCLSQAMTKITFPPFKNPRQSASHTIHITGVKRAESTEE